MTERQDLIDNLARNLVVLWVSNKTLSGQLAFLENERQREELLNHAEELGIRDDVYTRAVDIMWGT